MKQKIKALKGKTVRLEWDRKNEPFETVGIIKKLNKVKFYYKLHGNKTSQEIRYTDVKNVELI